MLEHLHVQEVVALAMHLQMPIIVFDFETTTLRGRSNFAVWEAAFVAALPAGGALAYDQLMDPQARLDPEVARMCNISDAQLEGKPTYDKVVLPHFAEYAPKSWFGGFNNKTFDIPAAKDMARRFGQPEPDFKQVFDVRQLHHELLGTGSKKGTLQEISQSYGVAPRGALHRAAADAALTMETFDAQLRLYGTAAVLSAMQELNAGKKRKQASTGKVNASAVAARVADAERVTLQELAQHFATDARTMSFEVGKAIDERLVRPEVFGAADVQDWLDLSLPLVAVETLKAGKLKPMLDAVSQDAPQGLDYIQLRVALMRNGIAWNTLKPV